MLVNRLRTPSDVATRVRHRLLGMRTPRTSTWDDIVAQVERVRPVAVGVDLFDTVLMRRVLDDGLAHRLAAAQIADGADWLLGPDDYLSRRAKAAAQEPDAGLEDWLGSKHFDFGDDVQDAVDLEYQRLAEFVIVVPGAAAALERLRNVCPIVFVSDMYHGRSVLERLLSELNLSGSGDRVEVSRDDGVAKASAGLYEDVFADELRRGDVAFIGDLGWSDAAMAENAGLTPLRRFDANPTRYESAMSETRGIGAVIAGASRAARLSLSVDHPAGASAPVIGCEVLGQITAAFLYWLRNEAQLADVTHLEFLARDGELPLRFAQAMPASCWEQFSLAYLHCGRRSWSLAAASLVGLDDFVSVGTEDPASFLLHSASTIPFRSVLARCGLVPSDMQGSALGDHDPDLPLGDASIDTYSMTLRSGELHDRIRTASEGPRELILAFLKERGLPNKPIGLVDVGWRGQQAWLMSALIAEVTGHEPIHFHFGGSDVIPMLDQRIAIKRFAFDDSVEPHGISSPVACLEMFLASGRQRLVGYEWGSDGVVELFDNRPTAVDNETRQQLWDGALEVAKRMPEQSELEDWKLSEGELREAVRHLLYLFWEHPTIGEATMATALRFENDDAGLAVGRVVRPYSPAEIRSPGRVPRQWQAGSLEATSRPFRDLMRLYFALPDRFRR